MAALSLLVAFAVMKLAEPQAELVSTVSAAPIRPTIAATIAVAPSLAVPPTIVAVTIPVTVPKLAVSEKPARRKRAIRSAAPVVVAAVEIDIFEWAKTILPTAPLDTI